MPLLEFVQHQDRLHVVSVSRGRRPRLPAVGPADVIDRLLLAGLGDQPLVVVPTGSLHHLPRSVLPSLGGRPTTVAVSARVWAHPSPPSGSGGVAIAGPGLPGAQQEAAAVAQIIGGPVLSGAQATVDAAPAAFGSTRLVHLAAHGRLADVGWPRPTRCSPASSWTTVR